MPTDGPTDEFGIAHAFSQEIHDESMFLVQDSQAYVAFAGNLTYFLLDFKDYLT